MRKILSLSFCFLLATAVFAQNKTKQNKTSRPTPHTDTSRVFSSVEQMPQYEGGQDELMKYLSTNIQYPTAAKEKNIEGRVVVQFVVCTDGSLCNEKIIKSVDSSMDQEVIRVVKAMPHWKPGRQNGQAVKAYYTLPVSFKLQGQEKDNNIPDAREYLEAKPTPVGQQSEDRIFTSVEHIAEFPGGQNALMKFLAANIKYPAYARDKNITGKAIVRFVVGKDGMVKDVVIQYDVPKSGFGEEAVRVVSAMPNWIPGTQGGLPVNTYYTLPITFKLDTLK